MNYVYLVWRRDSGDLMGLYADEQAAENGIQEILEEQNTNGEELTEDELFIDERRVSS